MNTHRLVVPLGWLSVVTAFFVLVGCQLQNRVREIPLVDLDSSDTYRIACVGDSITAGAGVKLKGLDSYPAQLQRMFGARAVVENFGVGGATLMNSGNKPYQNQKAYQQSLAYDADIVLILLGTNDTKADNWKHKDTFESDYVELIESYQKLESPPKIVIGLPIIVVGDGKFNITQAGVMEELPIIRRIARKTGVELVDLHKTLKGHEELIPDTVHPNREGYHLMANTAFEKLTGRAFVGKMASQKLSQWKGYKREDFDSNGRIGSLIYPEVPAEGNPWIWRTEFLGQFDSVDLALLEKGWVLAYVEMMNLYGAPPALNAMDEFYAKVVSEYGLNKRVVLEGFSRGGSMLLIGPQSDLRT